MTKSRGIGRGGKRPNAGRPRRKTPDQLRRTLSITVPPELMEALEAIRLKRGISRSALVAEILTAALKEYSKE